MLNQLVSECTFASLDHSAIWDAGKDAAYKTKAHKCPESRQEKVPSKIQHLQVLRIILPEAFNYPVKPTTGNLKSHDKNNSPS